MTFVRSRWLYTEELISGTVLWKMHFNQSVHWLLWFLCFYSSQLWGELWADSNNKKEFQQRPSSDNSVYPKIKSDLQYQQLNSTSQLSIFFQLNCFTEFDESFCCRALANISGSEFNNLETTAENTLLCTFPDVNWWNDGVLWKTDIMGHARAICKEVRTLIDLEKNPWLDKW